MNKISKQISAQSTISPHRRFSPLRPYCYIECWMATAVFGITLSMSGHHLPPIYAK
ncbi:hypothetical protein AG1IA_04058 [Rhizoctonia solani AG-1 IA]|uniref:Uncharacterized protein n=1 Tax=Thanatephorus cucumeris (strain AG1-IA) TaxID=983506 RepID=L8WUV5_THACA|nr:hypothetical protein AG1IA_04058 [Rhizoctonia solani AG-1 IA]